MAIAPVAAFIIGHFTGYGVEDELNMDQLTNLAVGSFGLSAVAIAALAVLVPTVSMVLGGVTSVSTAYVTGVLGQLTAPMDIFLEAGIGGVFGFLGTYVGYGTKVLAERLP